MHAFLDVMSVQKSFTAVLCIVFKLFMLFFFSVDVYALRVRVVTLLFNNFYFSLSSNAIFLFNFDEEGEFILSVDV